MLIAMLCITILNSSCSKDDDENTPTGTNIVLGKWKYESTYWVETYTFRENGTYQSTHVYKHDSFWNDEVEGVWSFGMNILTTNGRGKYNSMIDDHTWIVTNISKESMTVVEKGESKIFIKIK